MTLGYSILALIGYIAAGRITLRLLTGYSREFIFAFLNLSSLYLFFFCDYCDWSFLIYIVLVYFQYRMMYLYAEAQGWKPWLAFFTPISALLVVRYIPESVYTIMGHALVTNWHKGSELLGISYLAFRSSRLVLEVRNGIVKKPNLFEYLNFCFFLPTMVVGPINTYANYRRGFAQTPLEIPIGSCLMRITVGFVKYKFIGEFCQQLTYSSFLLDDHFHHWIDLPISILFFYLYLYCNFSGFCDMAIGASGLIGIPVPENFNNPFAARNMKEFWNRWHITLSEYMRDVLFVPLSKFLTRLLGPSNVNHAIALTIVVVFLLIGIWHGIGWNFAAFGAVQALGVVTNHYYTIGLKKWLGNDGFKAYNSNPWIHALAVIFTFCYYATSLILFANNFGELRDIITEMR